MENIHSAIAKVLLPLSRLFEICLAHLAEALERDIKVAGVILRLCARRSYSTRGNSAGAPGGKDEKHISVAETHLPAALCPLIKSSYGFALSDTCPYFAASNVIIGETTCDGKKKMFELMGQIKPVHVMQLPYSIDNSSAKTFWREEVMQLAAFLESETVRRLTDPCSQEQIELINIRNSKFMTMATVMTAASPPIAAGKASRSWILEMWQLTFITTINY